LKGFLRSYINLDHGKKRVKWLQMYLKVSQTHNLRKLI